jgi:hypothetical protein
VAAGQGMKRIHSGIVRPLTVYETARGYVYFTRDQYLGEVLNVEDFTAVLGDISVPHRRIDKFGRFQFPRSILRDYGTEQFLSFRIIDRETLAMEPMTADK